MECRNEMKKRTGKKKSPEGNGLIAVLSATLLPLLLHKLKGSGSMLRVWRLVRRVSCRNTSMHSGTAIQGDQNPGHHCYNAGCPSYLPCQQKRATRLEESVEHGGISKHKSGQE